MFAPTSPDDFLLCYRWGLLPNVVWAEARGESFEGKVAVAEVILERMRDPRWPDDPEGVILQPWQFSCFNQNDPNASLRPKPTDRKGWYAFQECCEAVAEAVGGSNLTKGSNHYVNLSVARPLWYSPDKVTATIGAHTFLRL